MFDTAGKVLVKLIRSRLAKVIRAARDLSPWQFGFRAGKPAVDSVMQVVNEVHRAEAHSGRARRMEKDLLGTLDNNFHVLSYLLPILII